MAIDLPHKAARKNAQFRLSDAAIDAVDALIEHHGGVHSRSDIAEAAILAAAREIPINRKALKGKDDA